MLLGYTGVRLDAPTLGRCVLHHIAYACAHFAKALHIEANAAGAIGVLVTVFGIAFTLNNNNLIPGRFHFVCNNLCDSGTDLLTHFTSVTGYFNHAIWTKCNKQVCALCISCRFCQNARHSTGRTAHKIGTNN